MRRVAMVILGIAFLVGCKKDSPKAPEAVTLVAPEKNSECTPVESTNGTSSVIQFSWLASEHTDRYELRVTDLETGTVQTRTTSATTETLSLTKGRPFSWVVVSSNSESDKTVTSGSWYFYNPGAETSYAPFPAEIISPEPGATVFRDINNEVTLNWSGADIDGDILQFEIFFSKENPPEEIIATLDGNTDTRDVSVDADTVYYWKVVTTDSEGNTSDSGVVDFRIR